MVRASSGGLFLEAGSPCLSESSSELGLLEKIARPLLALMLWELFNCRNNRFEFTGNTGTVMNKETISTGFLHFRPPNKASGRLEPPYTSLHSTAMFLQI